MEQLIKIDAVVEEFAELFLTDEIEKTVPLNSELSGIVYKKKDISPEVIITFLTQTLEAANKKHWEVVGEEREHFFKEMCGVVSSKQNQFTSTYERGYQTAVKNILRALRHFYQKKI